MPVLPPEVPYTEAEQRFMTNEPPGLWPENQNSIFGQLRRVLTDEVQANRDTTDLLSQEMFIRTAFTYLSLWEEMLGAIVNPAGKTVAQRRAVLLSRLRYGAFTRAQRDEIIADYVNATFGQPATFTLLGIPFGAGGIPLYGPLADAYQLFRVYENPAAFAYEVFIKNTNTPDIDALTRSLKRMTPAGIAFTIDNTLANILNYVKMVRGHGPSGYWKLGSNFNDSSGNGYTLTASGGVTAGSGATVVLNADSLSADFDGGDDVLTRSPSPALLSPRNEISLLAWINPDNVAFGGSPIKRTAAYELAAETNPAARFQIDGSAWEVVSPSAIVNGTTYQLVATFDGRWIRLYVNGVEVASEDVRLGGALDGVLGDPLTDFTIGSGFNGRIDEVQVYTYPLSSKQILADYKTGTNVP